MFDNSIDFTKWLKLAKAIAEAPTIAPCTTTDPEAFFPEQGEFTTAAKKLCKQCPVQTECLTYALETNQTYGVWGGLSAKELQAMRGWRRGRPAA